MKQGMGKSSMSGGKVEPRSTAVNPEYAAEIGRQTVHVKPVPASLGRGFEAPKPVAATTHKSGSQGRH